MTTNKMYKVVQAKVAKDTSASMNMRWFTMALSRKYAAAKPALEVS